MESWLQESLVPEIHREWTNDDWETPRWFMNELEAEFGPFDLDPCCWPETAKAPRYFTPDDDGLRQPWHGKVFCNPPFSGKKDWLRKAYASSLSGALVVCILPANTKDAWFHQLIQGKAEVRFLQRFLFEGPDGRKLEPYFGTMLVIYRPPADTQTSRNAA